MSDSNKPLRYVDVSIALGDDVGNVMADFLSDRDQSQ